jgi:hypothetical protein
MTMRWMRVRRRSVRRRGGAGWGASESRFDDTLVASSSKKSTPRTPVVRKMVGEAGLEPART